MEDNPFSFSPLYYSIKSSLNTLLLYDWRFIPNFFKPFYIVFNIFRADLEKNRKITKFLNVKFISGLSTSKIAEVNGFNLGQRYSRVLITYTDRSGRPRERYDAFVSGAELAKRLKSGQINKVSGFVPRAPLTITQEAVTADLDAELLKTVEEAKYSESMKKADRWEPIKKAKERRAKRRAHGA